MFVLYIHHHICYDYKNIWTSELHECSSSSDDADSNMYSFMSKQCLLLSWSYLYLCLNDTHCYDYKNIWTSESHECSSSSDDADSNMYSFMSKVVSFFQCFLSFETFLYLFVFPTTFYFTDAKAFGVDGYGAKASEKLMTVRGKDFRHEKTKKKRGSYRGGSITMDSNSFKYD